MIDFFVGFISIWFDLDFSFCFSYKIIIYFPYFELASILFSISSGEIFLISYIYFKYFLFLIFLFFIRCNIPFERLLVSMLPSLHLAADYITCHHDHSSIPSSILNINCLFYVYNYHQSLPL